MSEQFELRTKYIPVKKFDEKKRTVYGVVYEPYVLDTHGDMMEPEEIELMMEKFMQLPYLDRSIDTNHDNIPNGCYPVANFIARANDPDYPEGAWVMGVKIARDDLLEKVLRGDLNGFSFQAMVRKRAAVVEVEIEPLMLLETEPAEDGHTHFAFIEIDDDGKIVNGRTSTDDNHGHDVENGTVTGYAIGSIGKHAHRLVIRN